MKKLLIATAVSLASLSAIAPAHAATVAGSFNVTVNLTAVCTMGTIGDLAFGTYTAFQAAAATATTTATLTCSRGLTGVTAVFDTTAPGATAGAAATNPIGAGVLKGLQYLMTTTSATTAGTAATAASIGTADSLVYTINGSMPAAQAGTAPTGAGTQVRTLTVSY
jgi:spore coat protein U-like protein